MKNILFICNTYYQLIVAIQMKITLKKNDNVYLILTDSSKGAREVFARLEKSGFFKKIWFYDINATISRKNIFDRLKNIWYGFYGKNHIGIDDALSFDELIGYNYDIPAHHIYAYLKRKNKNMVCNRFEEGIFSYQTKSETCGELKAIYKLRSLLGLNNMRSECEAFYCFNPKAYNGELNAVAIPKILNQDKDLRWIINEIFDIGTNDGVRDEKYLYLPCIYDIEGGQPIGELELANMIAGVVGKENLLVKVHPRDDKTKYVNAGFVVEEESAAPLEALVINGRYDGMFFLTSLSGSILTVTTALACSPIAYYLYPLCSLKDNPMAQHYSKVLEGYMSDDTLNLKNVKILSSLEDIKN